MFLTKNFGGWQIKNWYFSKTIVLKLEYYDFRLKSLDNKMDKLMILKNNLGRMGLKEIEAVYSAFKNCPKCGSKEGFWLSVKSDMGYIQCKHCGAIFEICEVFPISGEKGRGSVGRTGVLRKIRL